jgi:O-antigen/teichoic acid export membrane protein
MGTNMLQVTVLLKYWSPDQYGAWLALLSISTLLTALDGGHQNYIGNLFNKLYVSDMTGFKAVLGGGVRVAVFLGSIQAIVVLFLAMSCLLDRAFDFPKAFHDQFGLALVIYTWSWISVGSIGSIIVRLFTPSGYYVRSIWWNIVIRLSQFIILAFCAYFRCDLILTACFYGVGTILLNLVLFWDLARVMPQFWPWWMDGNLRIGFTNFSKSIVLTFTGLLDGFTLQGVNLLITGFLGVAVLPIFATLRTVANTAMQSTMFLLSPITPDLVRFHVGKEWRKLTATFQLFWFTTGLFINFGLLAGLFFIEPGYKAWTQGKLAFDRSIFVWLVIGVIFRTAGSPFSVLLQSLNRLRTQFIISFLRGLIALVFSLLLLSRFGLAGIASSLAVAELVCSILIPYYFTRIEFNEMGGDLPKRDVISAAVSTAACCLGLTSYVMSEKIFNPLFVMSCIGCLLVTFCQWKALAPGFKNRFLAVLNKGAKFKKLSSLPDTVSESQ